MSSPSSARDGASRPACGSSSNHSAGRRATSAARATRRRCPAGQAPGRCGAQPPGQARLARAPRRPGPRGAPARARRTARSRPRSARRRAVPRARAAPRSGARSCGRVVRSTPSTVASPEVTGSSPAQTRSRLVLPAPLAPTTTTTSPWSRERSTPARAGKRPARATAARKETTGAMAFPTMLGGRGPAHPSGVRARRTPDNPSELGLGGPSGALRAPRGPSGHVRQCVDGGERWAPSPASSARAKACSASSWATSRPADSASDRVQLADAAVQREELAGHAHQRAHELLPAPGDRVGGERLGQGQHLGVRSGGDARPLQRRGRRPPWSGARAPRARASCGRGRRRRCGRPRPRRGPHRAPHLDRPAPTTSRSRRRRRRSGSARSRARGRSGSGSRRDAIPVVPPTHGVRRGRR